MQTHSHSVSPLSNQNTHSINPQFHVVHDDNFTTVGSDGIVQCDAFLHLMTQSSARTKAFLEDPKHELELADEWLASDEQEACAAL